jgi:hypothetical protein
VHFRLGLTDCERADRDNGDTDITRLHLHDGVVVHLLDVAATDD